MASVIQMVHGTKFIAICGLRLLLETLHITWDAPIPEVNWIRTIRIMVSVFGFSRTKSVYLTIRQFDYYRRKYQKISVDRIQSILSIFSYY